METNIEVITENVKKKFSKIKWGVGLGAALVLTPLLFFIASFLLGVAAVGVAAIIAGIVGLAIINFTPVVVMKMQNAKLNMIIAEAQKNPIPTLWAGWEKDGRDLDAFDQSIVDYETEVNNVEARMESLSGDLTKADKMAFQKDIAVLREDVRLQTIDLATARKDHEQHEIEIKRASAIWDMTLAMAKASSKNKDLAGTAIDRIKKETALEAVSKSMSRSKAQLSSRIRSRASIDQAGPGTPALTHQPVDVLEMESAKDVSYSLKG